LLQSALIAAALVSSLAGCGGGSGTAVRPVLGDVAGQAPARLPGSIVVRIPSTTSSTNRRLRYVSPSSLSAKVSIGPGQGCAQCSPPVTIEVGLYGVNQCTITGGVRTCTIALNLLPGTYTGTMTIYDSILDAQGHATGKPLSGNASFPIPIAPGGSNAVGVTLDGIPTSLAATILTASTMVRRNHVINGVATTAYRVIGANAAAQLALVAKDVDGNTIVGPGAPTWTANANPAGFTTAVNGNTLTITAPAVLKRQDAALTINAVSPACADPTAKCTLSGVVGFAESIAVTDPGFPRVVVWTIGASAVSAVITQGLSFPCPAVAFAPNGTLFVANGGNNTVTAYAPPYTAAPTVISKLVDTPVALAVDANNDLVVANNPVIGPGQIPAVTVYPPPYTTTNPVRLIATPLTSVAIDPGNRLWVLYSGGGLERYPAPYASGGEDVTIGQPASNFHSPSALALDAAGRPYVANSASNTVLRFDPPFSNQAPALTIPSTASQPILNPSSMAVASDGTIFVANDNSVGLGFYSPTGAPLGASFGIYINPLGTHALAADADDTMWLAPRNPSGPVGFPTPYGPGNYTLMTNTGFLGPDAIAIFP
jgi:hypothetical protein